ncbi:MAG: DNA primase [Candidatus Curtissbacteria bacterium]|nr:DNA primase [Candidatus Curtissbacteria bacterium]
MDQVDEVKSKVDIVEVISSYIPLKKAGRNYSGLCPFHSEKTPSFMVSPERQAFKCFGCSESGDVFTFVEKMEGWEFRETLEELAKKAGVKLANFKPTTFSKQKDKLIEINKLTVRFYKYLLSKHKSGEPGRVYLQKREVPEDLWEKYDLGYAPEGWENLSKFLAAHGFDFADIVTAGLVAGRAGRSNSYYDRFRGRLMFPLKDSRGTVLGFSGRVIDTSSQRPDRQEAKYINSPETPIFNKGSLLFGLDVARTAVREKNETVLVEGEFDVLSAYKAGLLNVVASKGTALTEKQVATLARICEKVIVCFDTDLAGDAASRRGIELLDIAGVNVRVVRLGKFKDPDEFAKSDPKGFLKAISDSEDVYDYFIESATSRFNPATGEGKKKIGKELLPILAKISDDLVRAHYIAKLANVMDLDTQVIADAVKKQGVISFEVSLEKTEGADLVKKAHGISLEEYYLALILFQQEVVKELVELLSALDFADENAKRTFKWLRDIIGHSRRRSASSGGQAKVRGLSQLLTKLPKELGPYVDSLYLVNISPDFGDRQLWAVEVAKTAKLIRDKSLRRQQALISSKLREAQKSSDEAQIQKLLSQFDRISEERKKIS